MAGTPAQDPETEVDALLRAARPVPDTAWADALERRLIRPRRPRGPGVALVAGLATAALAFALAGVGPLAHDSRPADARETCRWVSETRTERVPLVSQDSRGEPMITYRERTTTRPVLSCAPPRAAGGSERAR